MHRGPAAHVLYRLAVDIELEGGVIVGTLYCALENEADLYVNGRQKIRHYPARSTEERRRRKKKNAKSRNFVRAVCT